MPSGAYIRRHATAMTTIATTCGRKTTVRKNAEPADLGPVEDRREHEPDGERDDRVEHR